MHNAAWELRCLHDLRSRGRGRARQNNIDRLAGAAPNDGNLDKALHSRKPVDGKFKR